MLCARGVRRGVARVMKVGFGVGSSGRRRRCEWNGERERGRERDGQGKRVVMGLREKMCGLEKYAEMMSDIPLSEFCSLRIHL